MVYGLYGISQQNPAVKRYTVVISHQLYGSNLRLKAAVRVARKAVKKLCRESNSDAMQGRFEKVLEQYSDVLNGKYFKRYLRKNAKKVTDSDDESYEQPEMGWDTFAEEMRDMEKSESSESGTEESEATQSESESDCIINRTKRKRKFIIDDDDELFSVKQHEAEKIMTPKKIKLEP